MLTNFKKRSALLVTLAVACATVAIVPQTASAQASKLPNGGTTATGAYTAPTNMGTMTACPPNTAAAAGFSDTTSTDVDCIKMFGITQGTTATTFEPDGTIPRWQMALFIHRMFGPTGVAAAGTTAVPSFTDTSGLSAEIQAAITALASHGITLGTSATTFGPDDNVTREQMAMFLKRFAAIAQQPNPANGTLRAITLDIGAAGAGNGDHQYTDIASATSEGYESIVALYNLGVTEGACLAGASYNCALTYRPSDDITRGEMASFIKRLLDQTNARPAGVTTQAVEGIATAGAKTTMISVRGDDFSPTLNAAVDEFYDTADTAAERALEDPFNALGVCSGSNLGTAQGTLCTIDAVDLRTNSAGNVMGYGADTEASHTTDWYVWTGSAGDTYNESSAPGYLYSVTMPATATQPTYATGSRTAFVIDGGDLGYAEILNMSGYHANIDGSDSDDGILTYQGTSRNVSINMSNASGGTIVDGYTFKLVETTVSYAGTTSISTSYITSTDGVASFTVTCSADPDPLANNEAGNGGTSYWEHHHVAITSATAAGSGAGVSFPTGGSDPLSGMTAPTKGGGDGGEVNISCDDEARAYDATGDGQTLEISNNHYVASTAGSLVTITSTAYDQYGAGIAGVNTKVTQSSDGAGANNLAVITSNSQGKASTSTVVCASGSQANGTEAFAVAAAGGQMKNITATAPNAGGVAAVEGTTVYCSTAVLNASTAGGDGFGPVTDVPEIIVIQSAQGAGNAIVALTGGSSDGKFQCTYKGTKMGAAQNHDVAHGDLQTALRAINGLGDVTVAAFNGTNVSFTINGVSTAMPAAHIAGGGFYVTMVAETGAHGVAALTGLVCGDAIGDDGDDLECTDGNACEVVTSVLRPGVPGATSVLIDDNPVENTVLMSTVTKTTDAAGASADGAAVYRSATWDTTNDQFNGMTGPGLTEAAFEAELAAITNASTPISGMIRTVATGSGISVFQLGA